MSSFCINHDKFNIILIGCGGTGGNLIPMLTRLIYSFMNTRIGKKDIKLTLVDGDIVEEKNLFRQPFIKQDVGKNKAQVFAERYGGAFGLEISYIPTYLHSNKDVRSLFRSFDKWYLYQYLNIIISCLDNDESRTYIYNAYNKHLDTGIWIDAGNEKTSGQVVMGIKKDGKAILPCVVDLYPEVLEKRTVLYNPNGCSRALPEDVKRQSQNLITNATAAVTILNFISNILLGEELKTYSVDFNTELIHTRPNYISSLLRKSQTA